MYSIDKLALSTVAFAVLLVFVTSCRIEPPPLPAKIIHWKPAQEGKFIGKRAPEFVELTWINSKPLLLSALKGKPVLIRFWRVGCPRCEESMPALEYFNRTYAQKGLVVIGIVIEAQKEVIPDALQKLGVRFPVALDRNGVTLKKYKFENSNYSSVAVLVDKKGIIRWVHPGGTLDPPRWMGGNEDSPAFDSLEWEINKAIGEKD